MPLSAGTKIGAYEILEAIGAGGMGEVYRARDTQLNRDVAIKALPSDVAQDPDRLARFRREAQLLAALNHRHIAAIHGLEEAHDAMFLVLELVDGNTLDEHNPQSIDECLEIAKQIAEALEAAHGKGIIHRDLKPANVKITSEGDVKVLDFGLAKAYEGDDVEATSSELSQSPTLTRQGTLAGVILGTAAYMSPEQAKGKPVDKRADIWSFGVVLFEILSRTRPFNGDSVSETLAAVLKSEPEWSALPDETPSLVRRLVRRCLEKDPKRRLHDIADARLEIEEALSEPEMPDVGIDRRSSSPLGLSAGLALLAAVVSGALVWSVRPEPSREVTRFSIELPPLVDTSGASRLWHGRRRLFGATVALSRDGRNLVYVGANDGTPLLYWRSLDKRDAVPIAGTEGGFQPFFSPDGKWVGFFSNERIKKVSLDGGPPLTLHEDTIRHAGASWSDDGHIVYADLARGLFRLPEAGGAPEQLALGPDDIRSDLFSVRSPHVLPGGRAVLYEAGGDVRSYAFETGALRTLVVNGQLPHYVSGYLLFARAGTIHALSFDPDGLQATGDPFPVVEGLSRSRVNQAAFSVAATAGSLAYIAAGGSEAPETRLVRVDRKGDVQPLIDTIASYYVPRVSPDGERIVLGIVAPGDARRDVWVVEVRRGVLTRITSGEFVGFDPIWSQDGKSVVYASPRGRAGLGLFARPYDGLGEEIELRGAGPTMLFPRFVTSDGQLLGFHRIGASLDDIGVIQLGADAPAEILLGSAYSELEPSLSPDGRWLAYVSDESGEREVYVRPFRGEDRKWRISTDGGDEPVWAPSGRELFYRSGDRMMSVAVSTEPELRPETPVVLFEGQFETDPFAQDGRNYDVFPDGESFVMLERAPETEATTRRLDVVLHWSQELEQLDSTR